MKGNTAELFRDAVFEAHFRAAVTRWRYRVAYDRANRLWSICETTQSISGPSRRDTPREAQ